jgi:hypothetical protein
MHDVAQRGGLDHQKALRRMEICLRWHPQKACLPRRVLQS